MSLVTSAESQAGQELSSAETDNENECGLLTDFTYELK